ncbi:MAG: methyltransferase domain-containing protein [Candidatus Marinimicrobia bacterium]|nr:methyltransferase domain-containing protein [Candidatus Neomarinimicrobiota bacterium]
MAWFSLFQKSVRISKALSYALFITTVFLFACATHPYSQDLDVPYVPTPQPVVDRMLELALVDSSDYVIDLGSGDGRIVISAAKQGATGHGIDLDPQRIREARENARQADVEDRVIFMQDDIFVTDFSQASVITMYLLSSVNKKLRPRLLEELRPGTRVVSHSFDMDEWKADHSETVDEQVGGYHRIYLWIIPARMDGRWTWSLDGDDYTMDVSQEFQEIDLDVKAGRNELETRESILRGKRLTFSADRGRTNYVFSGHVEDNTIQGTVQIRSGNDERIESWSATKR